MRKTRRLASVLLALVMVFALSSSAFAATGDYTITINNEEDDYTYVAYQIFAGEVGSGPPLTLGSIVWGDGIDSTNTELQAALTTAYGSYAAAEIAEQLITQADAEAFARIVSDYLVADAGHTSSDAGSTYTISDVAAGYYLIDNTGVPSGSAYSSDIMINVLENTSVNPKVDAPSSDKTVDDINDSENTAYTEGQTSADHDIGDQVPFTLTATLPDNYGAYETYKLIFHDVMDDGLTFNADSVTVYVTTNGTTTTVASGYTVATSTKGTLLDSTCTFEVQFTDTNALYAADSTNPISVAAGSVITVKYTAELNENAVIGESGNVNTSYIEYSNNPNWDGNGEEPTGETPPETVVVFTYKVTVNKVEEDENGDEVPLEGAGFTLYKYDAEEGEYVAVSEEITGGTSFTWKGLDDGDYMLVETTTPNGYNTMKNLYFTVVAEHDEDGNITSLVIQDASGTPISTGLDATFSTVADDGAISTNVVNEKGSNLPGTGGMGTTIFYIVGGLMVFGAAVLLITRRRMSKAE
ncbi:MAG: SpaH/EbpB family LPXTG-anchored major pilin [Lachnospiraceae bacterium]|nr:SpaH/EbpB family LPXTG-anchored major pilin [Lachnospiraceae bacterium]